jgi:hypothetical protein
VTRWADLAVVAAIVSPWLGMIILVVILSRHAERLRVVEREVLAMRDVLGGLVDDLGWKK